MNDNTTTILFSCGLGRAASVGSVIVNRLCSNVSARYLYAAQLLGSVLHQVKLGFESSNVLHKNLTLL